MTAYEREADPESDPEAENTRARLETLAEFMRLWRLRVATRQNAVTLQEIERLHDALEAIHSTVPDILEPTYQSVWRVLTDTSFLLLQRESGYDVTELWGNVIKRGFYTSNHIERMQRLAQQH